MGRPFRSASRAFQTSLKARDVKRLLVDALRQLPVDKPSIIHIAIETAEGRNVDRLRAQRIQNLLANFKVDRPVAGVFVHSLQCNDVIESTWEVDETVDSYFWPAGEPRGLPKWMLVAPDTVGRRAAHWELY